MVTLQAFPDISRVSVKEYLELEESSFTRHEYIKGELIAMAGSTDSHNDIVANLLTALLPKAKAKDCKVRAENFKVRTADDVFYYPDIVIICGPREHRYYTTKPCVLVEVLSESTVRNDIQEKALAYKQLQALQLYLMVDSRQENVFSYRRKRIGWVLEQYNNAPIDIPCLDVNIKLKEIYDQVEFF